MSFLSYNVIAIESQHSFDLGKVANVLMTIRLFGKTKERFSALFSLFAFLALSPVLASENIYTPATVRIDLLRHLRGAGTISIWSDSGMTVSAAGGSHFDIQQSTPTTVKADESAEISVEAPQQHLRNFQDESLTFTPKPGTPISIASGAGLPKFERSYRGTIVISNAGGALQAVNIVPVEDYLCGVVGAEIGANAPVEALKAQAIAARTYTLSNLNKLASINCDLDDTTRCQNYAGVIGETDRCCAAVHDTAGQVLIYDGKLVEALYSTDAGGVTACDVTGTRPYFQAVPDSVNGNVFGIGQPNHDWTLIVNRAELIAALQTNPISSVQTFSSLNIDGYDRSGRITTVTIKAANGESKTVSGPRFREIMGPDKLKSTKATMIDAPDGSFVFKGEGWGHGFGMSQRGAIALASTPNNFTYQQILEKYYVGATIETAATAQKPTVSAFRPLPSPPLVYVGRSFEQASRLKP